MHSFVGESTRARNDTHTALLVDVAWHDANFALNGEDRYILIKIDLYSSYNYLTRCNDSWTIRANQPGLILPDEPVFDTDHVLLRDSLSDANNEGNFSIYGFKDGFCCSWRRHIDHRSIWFH